MNKATNIELNVRTRNLLIVAMLFVSSLMVSQHTFTTIKKNFNPDAANLHHDLSANGDSLIVKSQFLFTKIGFLNNGNRKVVDFYPPVFEAKVAVKDFPLGNYTVLVYESDRIIVFKISRLMKYDDLEMINSAVVMNTEKLKNEDAIAKAEIDNAGINNNTINKYESNLINTTIDRSSENDIASVDDIDNINAVLNKTKKPFSNNVKGNYSNDILNNKKSNDFKIIKEKNAESNPGAVVINNTNSENLKNNEGNKLSNSKTKLNYKNDFNYTKIIQTNSIDKITSNLINISDDGTPKSYNISDLKREYVQTREQYRKINLRPNGKPYN